MDSNPLNGTLGTRVCCTCTQHQPSQATFWKRSFLGCRGTYQIGRSLLSDLEKKDGKGVSNNNLFQYNLHRGV